jgi:hypothetical protein
MHGRASMPECGDGAAGVWTSGVDAIDGPSTASEPVRTVAPCLPLVADCDCLSPAGRGRAEDPQLREARNGYACSSARPCMRLTGNVASPRTATVARRSACRGS